MASVDLYYHRPGCITCGKSQAFLERRKFAVKETVNAAKVRFEPAEALEAEIECAPMISAAKRAARSRPLVAIRRSSPQRTAETPATATDR